MLISGGKSALSVVRHFEYLAQTTGAENDVHPRHAVPEKGTAEGSGRTSLLSAPPAGSSVSASSPHGRLPVHALRNSAFRLVPARAEAVIPCNLRTETAPSKPTQLLGVEQAGGGASGSARAHANVCRFPPIAAIVCLSPSRGPSQPYDLISAPAV